MAEPISGIQNQTIILRVSHDSSHMVSLQQYAAQAAAAYSAQSVERKTQAQLRSTTNVQSTEQKNVKTATEGRSQGEYIGTQERGGKKQERNEKEILRQDGAHLLDVRV